MRRFAPLWLFLPLTAQETQAPEAIRWEADLAAAQKAAREDGKPVLAFLTYDG
jgi:hypothetical protein